MYQPPIGPEVAKALHQKTLGPGDAIDIDRLLAAMRRQFRTFVVCCAVALTLGVAYLATAVPRYTATVSLFIDNNKIRVVEESYGSPLTTDTVYVDSQVELLKSDKIALATIEKLNLIDDPSFNTAGSPLTVAISTLKFALNPANWFRTIDPQDAAFAKRRAAVRQLHENMAVTRVSRTYVLDIHYTSTDPEQAAHIANGIAEAYLNDQLNAKYDATRRVSGWLQERVDELRQKSMETDLAMQKFRTANNLISAKGQLVNEQQLAESNSQLILAQANLAQTEARYRRIKSIVENKQMDAAITEAINNDIVQSLREKYLTASKREAELSAKLGPNHLQPINLRNEMREYERLIFEELGRLAEAYRSDLEIARARQTTMSTTLENLTGVNAMENETLVVLRDLEREAETYRNLYQTFLQRYQEAVQQQSFPMTEARVITEAVRPSSPSEPKKSLVLALSLMLGGLAGAGLGTLREYRDRVFRTGAQVRDELGLEFLGMALLLSPGGHASSGQPQESSEHTRQKNRQDAPPASHDAEGGADGEARAPARGRGLKLSGEDSAIMRYAIDHPLSSFTETLRTAKVATDLMLQEKAPKIIGVISVLPGEGKSTISKNFASLLAHLGAKTLLIDGDIRNPGLSRAVAPETASGLLDAVLDKRRLSDLCLFEEDTGLAILPMAQRRRASHTSELLASPGMIAVLRQAAKRFDHIIIDLPPLGPVVDVRAFAQRVDAFIFVVEWGSTARNVVRNALAANDDVYQKTVGVILNKVRQDELQMYENYGSTEYYRSAYSAYYRSDD